MKSWNARAIRAKAFTALIVAVLLSASTNVEAGGDTKDRALVLGGGGPVGEAWESGVIAGLIEKGVDLARANLIVGTSAGAVVGARFAARLPPSDLFKAALVRSDGPPDQAFPQGPPPAPPDLSFLIGKFREMGTGKQPDESIRAAIGGWAQTALPVVSESLFVESFKRRFPTEKWPSPAYQCTSVASDDGFLQVWGESSGVPLAIAVAASCAFPGIFAPVTIDGHRYMDGGIRSATNADLARGFKTVVVVAPTIGQADVIGQRYAYLLEAELKSLQDGGSRIELIVPDAASLKAFGPMLTDEGRRSPAADAGRVEGRGEAAEIATAWNE